MEENLNQYRLLLVDDDQLVLNALRRELSTPPLGRNHYEIEIFTSPAAALERAGTQAFDLVISDYLMPEMNGLAFLDRFSRIQPDASRIVLSGQADMPAILQAVNQGHVYRFITKPWHDYYLKGSVSQALSWRAQVLENRRLADQARRLQIPLPQDDADELCRIMVVDDDASVNNALYRELTHHSNFEFIFSAMRSESTGRAESNVLRHNFFVETYTSVHKALQAAREIPFQCVIADYRMPEMNGVEFLQAFELIQPDCARIMMSGFSDMSVILDAINLAHVFSFFNKPWNEFELKSAICQAIYQRRMLMENRLLAEAIRQHAE